MQRRCLLVFHFADGLCIPQNASCNRYSATVTWRYNGITLSPPAPPSPPYSRKNAVLYSKNADRIYQRISIRYSRRIRMWDYYRDWIQNTGLYHIEPLCRLRLRKRQEKSGQQGLENTREFAHHMCPLRTLRSNRGNAHHAPQDPQTQVLSGVSVRGHTYRAHCKTRRSLLTGIKITFKSDCFLKTNYFTINYFPQSITILSRIELPTNRIMEVSKIMKQVRGKGFEPSNTYVNRPWTYRLWPGSATLAPIKLCFNK